MSEPVRPTDGGRSATIETPSDDPVTVAAALRPDNTSSIRTDAASGCVRTAIERDTTGGLASTVDDYLVNLGVAETVAATARLHARPVGAHNENGAPTDNQPNNTYETHE
ncbi:KEOPS complex subunit Pcc1 [Halalkalirubrum salinum]|uniref:KEOPS complex subunit Pcc1 n=1 Tax=Halalkalirubrum salinum TaxID=2563889 RepID=UPI001F0FE58F|nr:KEOPS complex subunit Pcc1 [Halalkalirubrum salinum]